MFTALIADDEPLARVRMRSLLEAYSSEIEILGEASSGAQTIDKIHELDPCIYRIVRRQTSGVHRRHNPNLGWQRQGISCPLRISGLLQIISNNIPENSNGSTK